jgi:3-oxoadipate enol-lactonase
VPVAEVNGQRIFYTDSGGAGPAVLFAHGFLMDHEMFAPQIEALSPEFRVIAWDARGFGDTEFDGKPFDYWDNARDCLGLMDSLGLDRAVLGGMSQGGFCSLRAALLAPGRVRGLVLIDTSAGAEEPDQLELYGDMIDAWVNVGPGEELARIIAGIIIDDPVLDDIWIAKWKARDRSLLAQPGQCLLHRDDITDRLAEISCPALVLHGTEDGAFSMDVAETLAAGLSGCAGVVPIAGAAHASNLSHPDQVNPPLLDFLRSLPA